jgi:hypothetical protein
MIYYMLSRANGTGSVFEAVVDRQDFLKTLAEWRAKRLNDKLHHWRKSNELPEDRSRLWFGLFSVKVRN